MEPDVRNTLDPHHKSLANGPQLPQWGEGGEGGGGAGEEMRAGSRRATDLVRVPIRVLRKGLIDTVIKVLVVGEDNMAAHVKQLPPAKGSALCLASGVGKDSRDY